MEGDAEYKPVPAVDSGMDFDTKKADKLKQIDGISLSGSEKKQKLSLFNGINIIVGCMIGSGIFISPTGILEKANSVGLTLMIWVLCGAFSAIGAVCYIELGLMIKKSGADYAYIYEAYGPLMAFIRLWIECMIIRPAILTIVGLAFAQYALKPFYPDCDPPGSAVILLCVLCNGFLTWVNCYGVKLAARFQDVFTVAKVLALIVLIVAGMIMLGLGHTGNFDNAFEGSAGPLKTSVAFYAGLFAYNGWNFLNFIIEEVDEPEKNLPIAIIISMSLVTVVYVLVNISYFTLLSPVQMLTTPAVAILFAEKVFGPVAFIIPICVAMSCFGTFNGVLLTSSRLFYVGAREGHMPQVFTMKSVTHDTPMPAVIFTAFLSLVYLAISDNIFALMNCLSFCGWLAIGVAISVIPYLRWKRPDMPRPYKVNILLPFIYMACTVFILVFPLIDEPVPTLIGLCLVLSAIPVYYILVVFGHRLKGLHPLVDQLTLQFQKLCNIARDEKDV